MAQPEAAVAVAQSLQTEKRFQKLRRFLRSPRGVIGLVLVLLLLSCAILAPLLAPQDPAGQDLALRVNPPGSAHWLGTDQLGRDVLSRMLYGARISLANGVVSVAIGTLLGTVVGLVAAYYGGWIESLLMAGVDILLGFRTYLLAILVVAILGPSLANLMIAIGLAMFPEVARVVRSEVLAIKQRDFVEAARSLGATDLAIMYRHVLPQALNPILVLVTFNVATAITVESALSFLGLGPTPPTPAWGLMISEGRRYILSDSWLPTIPGVAIMLTVLGFNLMGDALRDVLDPRLKGR